MLAKRLKQGDAIGLIAPCHVATREHYAPIIRGLEDAGYRVKTGENLYKATHGYAATPEERAADFNDMAADPDVRLVFFGGGEGANEVAPLIDYGAIAKNPKLYLSYSDGTDILTVIYAKTGLETYYGQTPGLFAGISDYDLSQFRAHMAEDAGSKHRGNSLWRAIRPGRAEGTLVGGYLGNFAYLLGSGFFSRAGRERYVLFLEDHEMFSSMDRLSAILARVEQSPFMDRVAGLLFGHYSENTPPELFERLARLGDRWEIPVAHCDDFGHGRNHAIFPIGCRATLDAAEGLEYCVREIIVAPYDPSWATDFERIFARVAPALSGLALSVEHVGSTSVPGLWAKPILDIDAVIPSMAHLPEAVRRLEAIGYRHRGNLGIEGREAFAYEGNEDFMEQHFYVCPADSPELRRHLAFRDYLRANPDARDEYSRVKREGARLYPHDIDAYIEHKGPLVRGICEACGL